MYGKEKDGEMFCKFYDSEKLAVWWSVREVRFQCMSAMMTRILAQSLNLNLNYISSIGGLNLWPHVLMS